MNVPPSSFHLSGLTRAARYYSREEAEELAALAGEGDIFAVVVDPRRLPGAFDATLGGFDAAEGFTVYVDPSGLSKLRAMLADTLTVDPGDPLHSLTAAELAAIAVAPLDANLAEQVIAAQLLAARGIDPQDPSLRLPGPLSETATDPHLAADARTARWIGVLALAFPVTFLLLAAPSAWELVRDPVTAMVDQSLYVQAALIQASPEEDTFRTALRMFLGVLIPVAASGALIFSRRRLRDGSARPMFPRLWRRLGLLSLIFILAVYLIPLAWVIWITATHRPDGIP